MNLSNQFDKVASTYNFFSGILIKHKKISDKIKNLSNYKSNFRVLEVGGGTGLVAKYFTNSKEINSGEIVVLDPSQKMLDKIKNPKIKKVQGIAQKIPFKDNYFDLVYCVDSFHHFVNGVKEKDYEKTFDICIKELLRVLNQKGTLVIVDFDVGKRGFLIKWIPFMENQLMRWGSKFFKREEMNKLFSKYNVKIEIYDMDKITYASKIKKR